MIIRAIASLLVSAAFVPSAGFAQGPLITTEMIADGAVTPAKLASANGPQTVKLRISGSVQSAATSKRNFGKLPKQYRAADWTVTNESALAIKVSLARILQEIEADTAAGVSILSATSSASVVEDAQGSNPINTIARVGSGAVGGFATCEGLHVCPSAGNWSNVILGAELATLVVQYVFPTLQTHALQSIAGMLPAVLALDAYGSLTGMILVELAPRPKGTPAAARLDATISIQVPAAAPALAAIGTLPAKP